MGDKFHRQSALNEATGTANIEAGRKERQAEMATTKDCVACAEPIQAKARLCKHCGTLQNDSRFSGTAASEYVGAAASTEKHDFSSWVRNDTEDAWREFFENLAETKGQFFAKEVRALRKAQKKLFLGVQIFKNLKQMSNIDPEHIVEIRHYLAETTYRAGDLELFGTNGLFIVKSNGSRDKNTFGYFATGDPVDDNDGPICDVAIWVHCPRCTDLLLAQDEDADFPDEGQFPDCPACFGNTPVLVDLVGSIAD